MRCLSLHSSAGRSSYHQSHRSPQASEGAANTLLVAHFDKVIELSIMARFPLFMSACSLFVSNINTAGVTVSVLLQMFKVSVYEEEPARHLLHSRIHANVGELKY